MLCACLFFVGQALHIVFDIVAFTPQKSVCRVYDPADMNSWGSAVYIGDGVWLTAGHVVAAVPHPVIACSNRPVIHGENLRAEKLADVGIIKTPVTEVSPMPLCDQPIALGADVLAIGFPGLTNGKQVTTHGYALAHHVSAGRTLHDAIITPGFSGGALVDVAHQCLAGINVEIPKHQLYIAAFPVWGLSMATELDTTKAAVYAVRHQLGLDND